MRILREERTQDTALRRAGDGGVVVRVDEGGDPEHVGEEDEFLAERRACLADARKELDRVHPFFGRDAIVMTNEVR